MGKLSEEEATALLKKTYKNDVLILSQLEMISNKVNTRLEKMNDIFKIKIN